MSTEESSAEVESVVEARIARLGARGEGVIETPEGLVFVPFAVPGDRIEAEIHGERGRMLRLIEAGADRIKPYCPSFGTCGGCAVQSLSRPAYAEWKRGLVVEALRRNGLAPHVEPLVDAHGEGRRRASLHVRQRIVGFMRARSHELAPIDSCPLFAPGLAGALDAARTIAAVLSQTGKPIDLLVTAADGLDMDIRGAGPLPAAVRAAAVEAARRLDLARLSNHGEILIELRAPRLRIGRSIATPPPGAFIQATAAGESALWEVAREGLGSSESVADLFAGLGAFSLRAAETARVHACDSDGAALAALERAGRSTSGLRSVSAEVRDLFRNPLLPAELSCYDAVIFDPPRAGAQAQAQALARSQVVSVIAMSCAPATFARDLAILAAGGYSIEKVAPIDQFRDSPHVEAAAILRKRRVRRRPRLLG